MYGQAGQRRIEPRNKLEINQHKVGGCTKEVMIMVQFTTGKEKS